jgi:hypothetical protein
VMTEFEFSWDTCQAWGNEKHIQYFGRKTLRSILLGNIDVNVG